MPLILKESGVLLRTATGLATSLDCCCATIDSCTELGDCLMWLGGGSFGTAYQAVTSGIADGSCGDCELLNDTWTTGFDLTGSECCANDGDVTAVTTCTGFPNPVWQQGFQVCITEVLGEITDASILFGLWYNPGGGAGGDERGFLWGYDTDAGDSLATVLAAISALCSGGGTVLPYRTAAADYTASTEKLFGGGYVEQTVCDGDSSTATITLI